VIEKISFQYPWWFFLFCILLGVLYSVVLYRKEIKFSEGPKWLKPLLSLLRAFAVSTIAFLLIGPIIKSLKEEEKKPIIIFAEDRSSSLSAVMSAAQLDELNSGIENAKSKLSTKYQVETIHFGEETTQELKKGFNDKSTNISDAIKYIYDNFSDQNIGSIILSTDGIYNDGSNPMYENVKFNAPLYTIGLGDTSIQKDISIKNVLHNKIAYFGDKTDLQIDLSAYNFPGQAVRLKVEKVGSTRKLLSETPLTIDNNSYFKTISVPVEADEVGIIKYSISVTQLNGENSFVNNKRDIFIEVLDGRQNVLILANAPHPDIAALNTIITSNKNYNVKTAFYTNETKPKVSDFDLVIFHNLPSDQNGIEPELAIIKNKNLPTIFVMGTQINQTKFNLSQEVIKLKGGSKSNEDAEPSINLGFSPFVISNDLKNQIVKFPPMTTLFGQYEASTGTDVLLYQKIKKVPTKYPLIAFNNSNGIRQVVIAGEGIWKWKLSDFVENKNINILSELINKTIQLVSVKEDKRKFRVNLPKNLFKENENIVFDAQLYNDAFEMINDPEVLLTIKDDKNKEFKYNFSKTSNFYSLDAGLFAEGSYSYKATTNYKGKSLDVSGKFSVQSIQLEQYDLTARHGMLKSLSSKFGGSFFLEKQIGELAEQILKNENIKPVVFQTFQTKSIINYKWLFFALLFFLSLEWFLRRYFGSY
jgi:hypothetical protein